MDYNELYKKAQQALMEHKVHVKEWCMQLVDAYEAIPGENKSPLPGKTAEELIPALFTEPFNEEQYRKEASVLENIQKEVIAVAMCLNEEEAKRCLLL